MNRQCYRIIFNRLRCLLMVVPESTRSRVEANTVAGACRYRDNAASLLGLFKRASLFTSIGLLCGSLVAFPLNAAVVAYKPAPKTQQAIILNAGNGVPVVNIQTPSAAGVSHNKYSQFDIGPEGVILNNSRTNVQTQLGGWVQGNSWLATGAARVILNEVISANPSRLLGYIEVAGRHAEVIIANPSGISCNGCGFINVNQATLTTGRPIFSNGNLDSYRVEGGTITIQGAGLDASRTDFANLIARAVEINAGIWANSLTVTTGANQIDVASGKAISAAGTGSAPTFAIDVATLGGMYAGKITLVGTEAGVGVRNAGEIGAGGALVLTADGRLENSGRLIGAGNTRIAVNGALDNSGTLYAQGNAELRSQGDISNTGIIAARGDTQISAAGQIAGSSASLFAAGLNAAGTLASAGNLNLTAGQTLAALGQNLAGAEQTLTGSGLDLSESETIGRNLTLRALSGNLDAADANLSAAGMISVTTPGRLTTDGAEIVANQLNLQAYDLNNIGGVLLHAGSGDFGLSLHGKLDNTGGRIAANAVNLSLATVSLTNTDGIIQHAGSGNLSINAAGMGNRAGEIHSAGSTVINADSFDNLQGTLTAAGGLSGNVSQGIDNRFGRIAANIGISLSAGGVINNGQAVIESAQGDISLKATGAFDNSGGALLAARNISLNAVSLANADGRIGGFDIGLTLGGLLTNTGDASILSRRDLTLNVGSLDNREHLQSGRHLTVNGHGSIDNSGTLLAQGRTTLTTIGDMTNTGIIAALGDTQISAGGVIHGDASSLFAAGLKPDGTLNDTGNLAISASHGVSALGQNLAGADQTITGGGLYLSGSETIGRNLTLRAHSGNLEAKDAVLVARADLIAATPGTLFTDGASLSAKQLNLYAHDLSNIGGELLHTGSGDFILSLLGTLDNTDGRIAANATNLTIGAASLTNTDGGVEHAGSGKLEIGATTLNGTRGVIQSNGSLNLKAASAKLDNGRTLASRMNIDSAILSNVGGEILQTGSESASIKASTVFDNRGGSFSSNGNTTLAVGNLNNQGGLLQTASASNPGDAKSISAANFTITAVGAIDNSALKDSDGNLILDADGRLQKGMIQTGGNALISAANIDNQQGTLTAEGSLTGSFSHRLDNRSGLLIANSAFRITTGSSISNVDGTLASVQSDVNLSAGGGFDNSRGKLSAGKSLSVSSQVFSNIDGLSQGREVTLDSRGHPFDNTRGTLLASLSLNLHGGAVINDAGLIQSGGSLAIDTQGQTLSNINSGSNKGILAQFALDLTTGALVNHGGSIGANGAIYADATTMDNQTGTIIGSKTITLLAGSMDNRAGRVESLDNLTLDTSSKELVNASMTLDNRGALLRSGKSLSLTAAEVDNRNTGGQEQGIEADMVVINSNILDNRSGAIRTDNSLIFSGSDLLKNDIGLISSAGSLDILDRLAQVNANDAAKTLAIMNAGGTVIAGTRLGIDSKSLTGDGIVLSQGDLMTKLTTDYTHSGEWQAEGNATFITTGTLTNLSKLLAGRALTIAALHLDNRTSAEIVGADTRLDIAGTLTNRGLIDGGDTLIYTATLDNRGSGRIYGNQLAIAATALNNADETVGGVLRSAVIAARERLDIGAKNISNRNGALLFSAGNMYIGGGLDPNRHSSGSANQLTNLGATIEALGNLNISSENLHNLNAGLTTKTSPAGTKPFDWFTPRGTSVILDSANYPGAQIGNFNISWRWAGPYRFREYYRYHGTSNSSITELTSSAPGKILSGGSTQLTGANLHNSDSEIVAGSTLEINAGIFNNSATQGQKITRFNGSTHYYDYDGNESCSDPGDGCYDISYVGPYNPAAQVTTFALATTRVEQNIAPGGSGAKIDALATGKVAQTAAGAADARSGIAEGHGLSVITEVAANNSVSVNGPGTVNGVFADPQVAGLDQVAENAANLANKPASVVRTINLAPTIPGNSLYRIQPGPGRNYLIETDPDFASYRSWLSSDYMLQQLAIDPALTQKRLGDGFYEQRLIREQVAQLTGRRFLQGYASDEAQYQTLMNNAATYAGNWNLIPGIALTEAQMAQLTSDMVWLIEREVTLADGSRQKVLVPQVYVIARQGDLHPGGALLSGDNIHLQLDGDLVNGGTIAGRKTVSLTAENIKNLGGRIAGNQTTLKATTDILNQGGRIEGGDRLSLEAGRDITVETTTQSSRNSSGPSSFSRTNLDRVASLYVSNPQGILVASAGRDINLIAAEVVNRGETGQSMLAAGRDLNLGTVTIAEQNATIKNATIKNASNYVKHGSSREIGSTIDTQSDITLLAGRDLSARAANVSSDGAIVARVGNDLTIEAGEASTHMATARKTKKSGTFGSKKTERRDTFNDTEVISSIFSGDTVNLNAGRDLSVQASNLVGTNDVNLAAGNNVTLTTAQATHDESHYYKEKKSGVFSNGAGVTVGSQKLQATNDSQSVTIVGSTVGSVEGNVNIEAGKQYTQTGSAVLAPKGDIAILAQQVDINAATDTYAAQQTSKFKSSGVSVSISNPVISAGQTVGQMARAAEDTSDPRMQALAAGTAALAVKNAYDLMQTGQVVPDGNAADAVGGINLNVSLGSSKSSSKSSQSSTQAVGSTVSAGRDVTIIATGEQGEGGREQGDLSVTGSNISAGRDTTLIAADTLTLQAAQNTASSQSKNKSSSASVGVSANLGAAGGMGITAGVSKGKGRSNGNEVTHSNTEVEAGDTLTLVSGNDTTLRGATASGKRVVADVGGNLNLESLQDSSSYKEKQRDAGLSVTVPVTGMGFGGSLSGSKTDIKSNYRSVTEQSGITAGDDGFQISVQGNTDLKGAVIASTQKAIDDNKNRLVTGSLTTSDLENKASYKGDTSSYTVGGGLDQGLPVLSGAGVGEDSGKANSTTVSAISGGTVAVLNDEKQQTLTGNDAKTTVALLNRDVKVDENGNTVDRQGNPTAGTLKPIFDAEKVKRDIAAQVKITQAFSQQAPQALNTFAESKTKPFQDAKDYDAIKTRQDNGQMLTSYELARMNELESQVMTDEKAQATLSDEQAKSDYENWNHNGNYRKASNILIAAISGDPAQLTSAAGKEALSWAADQMRQAMIEDSKKFPGICDTQGNCISNNSGVSTGVNGDNTKVAGSRIVLSDWCDQGRCEKDSTTRSGYKENPDGTVIFNPGEDENGNKLSIGQFVEKYSEQYELRSPLGGIQGGDGQMKIMGIQFEYAPNSFWDKLAEAYSGTHDTLNSIIWYDSLGNGKNLDGKVLGEIGSTANIVNVGLSTPFALGVLLPPEVWNAVLSMKR